jgi:hypothetical protein
MSEKKNNKVPRKDANEKRDFIYEGTIMEPIKKYHVSCAFEQ